MLFLSSLADRAWWEWHICFRIIQGLFSRHTIASLVMCNEQGLPSLSNSLLPLSHHSVLHFSLPLSSPTALHLLSQCLRLLLFFFLVTHFWPPTTGGGVATQKAAEIKPKSLRARAIFLRHGQVCASGLRGLMGPHSFLCSQKWQPVPLTSC